MVAHKRMTAQSCLVRQNLDIHPNNISQWLVCEFIKSGLYESHLATIKQEYLEKCNIMQSALLKYAPEEMIWTKPSGGYYFWCKLPHGVLASELLMLCTREGVVFMPGIPFFTYQNGESYMRLNFTTPTIEQIMDGVSVLCSNIRKLMNLKTQESKLSPSNYLPVY
jgi:DNA-binding transcriptional MocR family regulator